VFLRDPDNIYRVAEWEVFPWLIHGFGTRLAAVPEHFAQLATVKQIHSAECVVAGGRTGVLGEADAVLESTPGSVVAIKTADCIPVLLIDARLHAVAAVHAGWRGTAARISVAAVDAMRRTFGSRVADLHAAIGPGIGKCCYEVGSEVAAQFGESGRTHLDLTDFNRRQLEEAGVTPAHIHASKLCTMCGREEFHSFRRDGDAAGRMHTFAGIR
jgi:hypothetical protein